MTYNLTIDQEFAVINGLSLTQVSVLAAFMTLPLWANTISIDGKVWYRFSDEKMSQDFPLLFGVSKRCYKNASELATLGFMEIMKMGRDKYVRFTERCLSWNGPKDQKWTNSPKSDQQSENGPTVRKRTDSPKTDQKKSENGLKKSPKTDRPIYNYNINNNSYISDEYIAAEGGTHTPTQEEKEPVKVTRPRRSAEKGSILFADSRYSDFEVFKQEFNGPEFQDVDLVYYFHAVGDWSAQKGKKMKDWIATARNFIRRDIDEGKVHKVVKSPMDALPPDAIEYLQSMANW